MKRSSPVTVMSMTLQLSQAIVKRSLHSPATSGLKAIYIRMYTRKYVHHVIDMCTQYVHTLYMYVYTHVRT